MVIIYKLVSICSLEHPFVGEKIKLLVLRLKSADTLFAVIYIENVHSIQIFKFVCWELFLRNNY